MNVNREYDQTMLFDDEAVIDQLGEYAETYGDWLGCHEVESALESELDEVEVRLELARYAERVLN